MGGGGGSQTTSTKVEYSPEEKAARQFVWDEAQRIYGQSQGATQQGGSPIPGVAGQSGDTMAAQQQARNWAYGGAQDIARQGLAATQYGLTGAMDVNNNPALQGAIQAATRPITQNLQENILPGIRSQSVQEGGYGGSRAGIAEGLAVSRANQQAQDAAANLTNEAYKQGQDTFARTLALLPQTQQLGVTPTNLLSQVGAQNEDYQQELLNYYAAQNDYLANRGWSPVANLASAIYGGIQPGTVTTGGGGGSSFGRRASGALGGAATGAAIGSVIPGVGTAIGAGVGGLLGLFS